VIAVEIMTAEATGPFLSRDQFAMRNVERVALEFDILMALCAGRGNHGDSHAFVLAMAGYAGFCAKFGACLEKSRLKKSMHRVGILIAGMTTGALLVTDGGVAKCGVGGTQSEPELNFGLELLAHGSGRILVAAGAELAQIWRTLKKDLCDPYRPELHYMRGPGPKWREKHANASPPRSALALSLVLVPVAGDASLSKD
jgi:hypothetical protein